MWILQYSIIAIISSIGISLVTFSESTAVLSSSSSFTLS